MLWLTPSNLFQRCPCSRIAGTRRPGRSRRGRIAQGLNRDQRNGLSAGRARGGGLWRSAGRCIRSPRKLWRRGQDPLQPCSAHTLPRGAMIRAFAAIGRRRRRRTRWRDPGGALLLPPGAHARNSRPAIGRSGRRIQCRTSGPRTGTVDEYVAATRAIRRRDVAESPITRRRATDLQSQPRSRAI